MGNEKYEKKLDRLLNAKNLVVVGGLEAERVIEQCDKIGFKGTIYPIHPKRKNMRGRKCLKNVSELNVKPDAAYVAVNREKTIEVVKKLKEKNCGGIVCYAAGFAEVAHQDKKGAKLQKELVEVAGDMPVIGPNCYGFIHTAHKIALWPDQHGTQKCKSGVAIITQSSNIAINLTMQQRALPIAMMMTAGNQAQIGLSKLALALVEKKHITAIGLHIEGLDNIKEFEELANKARKLKKPIVVLKVGKSQKAREGTITHTASMAGADETYNALFTRLAIARVEELETFIETLKLLDCGGPVIPKNAGKAGLLSMSCSGGEASLMADYAEDGEFVCYPNFTKEAVKKLRKELGEMVNIANPLDYNTFIWGDWRATQKMFGVALKQKFDLTMLVIDFPRSDQCNIDDWVHATNAFANAVKQTKSRAVVIASMKENLPEDIAQKLRKKNVVAISGMKHAISAINAATFIAHQWTQPKPMPLMQVSKIKGKKYVIYEDKAKIELKQKGLKIPKGIIVKKNEKINEKIKNIKSPFVVKGMGIAHKTEKNAVRLNVKNIHEIEKIMQEIKSDKFLIEEMMQKISMELIIGVHRDTMAMVLTIGAGGVFSELIKDKITLLIPTQKKEIMNALKNTQFYTILKGYRGREKANMKEIIKAIESIEKYAMQNEKEIEELDVNPLVAMADNAVAVDAIIVKRKKI